MGLRVKGLVGKDLGGEGKGMSKGGKKEGETGFGSYHNTFLS